MILLVCLSCSVPDSPHEPDPESYEPLPPKLIPLDEVSLKSGIPQTSIVVTGVSVQNTDVILAHNIYNVRMSLGTKRLHIKGQLPSKIKKKKKKVM